MDPRGSDGDFEHLKRFSIQPSRMMSKGAMMQPRRRASVSNGQAMGHEYHSGNTLGHDPSSSYVTMDASDLDYPMAFSPYPMAARVNSLREQHGGTRKQHQGMPDRYGMSMKAHLRDSVRTGHRTLQHHLSREALPQIDNYNMHQYLTNGGAGARPTLDELYLGEKRVKDKDGEGTGKEQTSSGVKFGWIQGVFIRCLLNIWGVMLFLRLSWVVAEAGVAQAILVVLLATAVTSITTLSMSAISTNGMIKGGGTYFMISRSLGPEFGAAIGIIYAIANAFAVSLHTVGFCESLNDLLLTMGVKIVDNGQNDIRIIGSITLVVLAVIVSIGMEWEAKAQLLLMVILAVSLVNFLVGSFMGPADVDAISKGFVGYDLELLSSNFFSDYRVFNGFQQNFFSVFAIFFPAATGILAGANISGDLKDPSVAIPKGTLLAIAVTSMSYILFAIIAGATVLRDASGNPEDYINGTVAAYQEICNSLVDHECKWGLHNSYQVMTLVSAFGPLNYAGCFAATLSSALACFVSAPKVFQALCRDKLFPYLHVFAKGYGKNQEPLRAYALTFIIALAFILIAELNVIAPLISNFCLASYALVNFSTFHVDLIQPIGWRPTFKYYNKWLSLVGCVLSVSAMFLCSWPTALITFAAVFTLFMVVKYRKPQVNWGSSTQAQAYKTALITVQQLNTTEDHVKTYTPQILVMTGAPNMRPSLVDFAYLLCKNNSLMVCGDVVHERQNHRQRSQQVAKISRWLRVHKTKAFYSLLDNLSFSDGVGALLQASGIGKMKPNILLLGYQSDWRSGDGNKIDEYFAAIHTALEMHVAVAVLRVPEGLDYTGIIADFQWEESINNNNDSKQGLENPSFTPDDTHIPVIPFNINGSIDATIIGGPTISNGFGGRLKNALSITSSNASDVTTMQTNRMKKTKVLFRDPNGNELPQEVMNTLCRFRLKQKRGTIDVWWLYDDGGLSMLLPHILTTRANWGNSKIRVFCLAGNQEEQVNKETSMRQLLNKFRIDVSDVIVIPDITAPPSATTKAWFDNLTSNLVKRDTDATKDDSNTPVIKQSELMNLKPKTFNYMRLRELLSENSTNANLVVMTLPMPRKGTVSGPLYMAWLETLTANMPPFLLVRGNQTSVLTFYS